VSEGFHQPFVSPLSDKVVQGDAQLASIALDFLVRASGQTGRAPLPDRLDLRAGGPDIPLS